MPPDDLPVAATGDGVEVLRELALNLRSSWNHQADTLWEQIDPALWRATGNPWVVLQSASPARLDALWKETRFRDSAAALLERRRSGLSGPSWFSGHQSSLGFNSVAFFSMEYAVSETLPLYAGGLGNVAGDYLKAASDLGLPLVGVGLLYQQGYFRQTLEASGAQREFWPPNDSSQLPIIPLRGADGAWIRIQMPRAGQPVWLRTWRAQVGRVPLYLLDSNDPANEAADRGITAGLYAGGEEMRLLQEIALGIGGWRLLRALGLAPEVCHLNEGHCALAALERAREFMQTGGHPLDVAVAATRTGNVFTSHTPVEAGFDRFPHALVDEFLGRYLRDADIGVDRFMSLGRAQPADEREPLNMAWLAARLSGSVNAVSRRHEGVSRRIFQVLFPRWPEAEVPIGHVTNGVHVPSWDSPLADAIWTRACGPDRWRGGDEQALTKVDACPDAELWGFRRAARARLVSFVRERLTTQLAGSGLTEAALAAAAHVLDPDALTIGLARRFTDYKRPTLLLHDPERFVRLLKDDRRRVQVVVAGKAHPRDEQGKGFVQEWVQFVRRNDVRVSGVFLADYDLRLAEQLVQGVDLWINTPRPPWEACGTSGMKVLVNGGLNLSVRDGWWDEAYRPEVGWALDGPGTDDAADATRLYELLEREVVPAFYERDPAGVPRGWVARMRASMASLTPAYSAGRAMREYCERYYGPAAKGFVRRIDSGGAGAERIARWQGAMQDHWPLLRFGQVRVHTAEGRHHFEAHLYLDDVGPESVCVELYAESEPGGGPARVTMRRAAPLVGASGFVYVADVDAGRPASHYTPRARAVHQEVDTTLEAPFITWAG